MVKPTKLPKKEYSEEQLHELGEILLKAKDIEADAELLALVKGAMKGKVNKIKSLDDLREKANSVAKEERDNEEESEEESED